MKRHLNWGILGAAGIARTCVLPAMAAAAGSRLADTIGESALTGQRVGTSYAPP